MKILLVQPLKDLIEPGQYVRSCYVEPLGLEYLKSFLDLKGYHTTLKHPVKSDYEFRKIIEEVRPKIVGFSVYTYALSQALSWAKIVKNFNNSIVTVFGGYHPSGEPSVVDDECVDYGVIGEGELTFSELCRYVTDRIGEIEKIDGLTYVQNGSLKVNKPRKRIGNLDRLPLPYRDGTLLRNTSSYQVTFPPASRQKAFAQVMYSRGCPFSCRYCMSSTMWGKHVIWRSAKNVVDEMEYLNRKYGTNLVYFPDLTFNCSEAKIVELCKELIARDIPVYWWPLCRIDRINKDLMALMKSAKCVKLTFGLEAVDPDIASKIKGNYSPSWKKIKEVLYDASSMGLITRTFLMVGIPDVPMDYYEYTIIKLEELDLDEVRQSFYTPFPGTKLFDECVEKGLIPNKIDYSLLTTDKPVIKTCFSKDQLIKIREKVCSSFYTSETYMNRIKEKIKKFPYLKDSYLEGYGFLLEEGLFQGFARKKFSKFAAEIEKTTEAKGYLEKSSKIEFEKNSVVSASAVNMTA